MVFSTYRHFRYGNFLDSVARSIYKCNKRMLCEENKPSHRFHKIILKSWKTKTKEWKSLVYVVKFIRNVIHQHKSPKIFSFRFPVKYCKDYVLWISKRTYALQSINTFKLSLCFHVSVKSQKHAHSEISNGKRKNFHFFPSLLFP